MVVPIESRIKEFRKYNGLSISTVCYNFIYFSPTYKIEALLFKVEIEKQKKFARNYMMETMMSLL